MWEILKWVLIVNGLFLLIYGITVFVTRNRFDDDDWGDSKKNNRRR